MRRCLPGPPDRPRPSRRDRRSSRLGRERASAIEGPVPDARPILRQRFALGSANDTASEVIRSDACPRAAIKRQRRRSDRRAHRVRGSSTNTSTARPSRLMHASSRPWTGAAVLRRAPSPVRCGAARFKPRGARRARVTTAQALTASRRPGTACSGSPRSRQRRPRAESHHERRGRSAGRSAGGGHLDDRGDVGQRPEDVIERCGGHESPLPWSSPGRSDRVAPR
jgi:hypothetical protein